MTDQEGISVSTDKTRLDIGLIHNFLTTTYWAKGRTLEQVKATIEHSVCFGLYVNGAQVGFARVATDRTVFAYIMDVFILESHRGQGLGKRLISEIVTCDALKHVPNWLLATDDAHGLYAQFGFTPLSRPGVYMER
jgi:GNAT superfamily N-acetyltransferase